MENPKKIPRKKWHDTINYWSVVSFFANIPVVFRGDVTMTPFLIIHFFPI